LVITSPSQAKSRSHAAFQGWRSRSDGSFSAISASLLRMNPSSIGIGFSHHNVTSLSNTATRSGTGT
jgi:pheromone shutdown protein TraB